MHHIIAEIASDNSKLHKEAVLEREARVGNKTLFDGLKLCYDAMITFGIKQVPESTRNGPGLGWEEFKSVAELFIRRDITGNAARMAVEGLMIAATQEEWNGWYRRILIKDMRAGFSEVTVNKSVRRADRDDFVVPVFECQLAHDGANHESKLRGKKLLDYKLDGVRVLAVIRNGNVTLHSRNGKVFENFAHIENQIRAATKDLDEAWVLDGEITSSTFQDLMKQVHRKRDADATDAVYNLFDIVPLRSFQNGRDDLAQIRRSEFLRDFMDLFRSAECDNIRMLDFTAVDLDTEEGMEVLNTMRSQAKDMGLEGVMVKDADAPYECKRTTAWLKLKPFIEVSLSVKDIEEGTGRNEGRLGALVCEGEDDGNSIRVNVGSGFSDSDRVDFWNNRVSIMGQTVEVRADAVTQNQDGTYSLRFPRFLRFRGFEPGEKI